MGTNARGDGTMRAAVHPRTLFFQANGTDDTPMEINPIETLLKDLKEREDALRGYL